MGNNGEKERGKILGEEQKHKLRAEHEKRGRRRIYHRVRLGGLRVYEKAQFGQSSDSSVHRIVRKPTNKLIVGPNPSVRIILFVGMRRQKVL